jgi:adenosylmethionine-8-amino-7-oxononanoate aminotransferase
MSGYDPDGRRRVVVGGDGVHVTDQDGTRYLDGKSGLWCVNVGYGRDELAAAGYEQLRTLPYYPLTESHPPAVALAEKLDELLGGGYVHYFSNSGSEAVEMAVRIARQYHRNTGAPDRWKVVSRYRAYHGGTPHALAASGQNLRKLGYEPLPPGFLHVAPPDEYRCHLCRDRCTQRCAAEVQRVITAELPETVAAVLVEPVVGGGGVIVPADGHLAELRAICDRSGALLVVDEAVCGFGRTGTLFGFQHEDVRPDVVVMAKAVTSGYFPMAVTAVRREIHRAFPASGPGRLRHITTFGGHPVGCAIALANIDIIEREGLVERSRCLGRRFQELLAPLADLPHVGQVRGRGLLAGIELVEDKRSRRPVEAATSQEVLARCLRAGLIVGATATTSAGLGNVITVGPPLVADDDDLAFIASTLGEAVATLAVR